MPAWLDRWLPRIALETADEDRPRHKGPRTRRRLRARAGPQGSPGPGAAYMRLF
jgi:hypothetical protein